MISSKDEEKLGESLKKIQKEILIEMHRICVKNNIRYYLAYGTLLGAIRHNGFIPWDDDIDIMMPYEDMVKFEEACKTELDLKRFFYQTPQTDPEYRLSINRVRRNDTKLVEERYKDKNMHQGVFVDIYPLYGAAPLGIKRKVQVFRAMKRALYLLDEPAIHQGKLVKIATSIMLKLKSKKAKIKAEAKLFEKMSKYSFDESENVSVLDSNSRVMNILYKREWFGNGQLHKFEDIEVYIPVNYDKILTLCYSDYMKLPPENERKMHHDFYEIKLLED